ncbi:MAG: NYN domain-containing protein, partial [Pyrinomonadaceae bacterium]
MKEHMSTYIFIDGGYLRSRHAEITRKWFGCETEIEFSSVISRLDMLGGRAVWLPVGEVSQSDERETKSFYYDCLDEERRQDESESEFLARLEKQNVLIENIRDVDGCHIRLGVLKGSRRIRRQKEVDILLAVDMIAHAAQRNMTKVVLLAGDQDFKPAVESLVQLGIFVHIVGDAKHTSRELTWAASAYTKLTF